MGCDPRNRIFGYTYVGFNPRTRMGCDDLSQQLPNVYAEFQSTHPHGVRQSRNSGVVNRWCFNPRTRMGCDTMLLRLKVTTESFNPRTRMGCDKVVLRRPRTPQVSIHAPAWGATQRLANFSQFTGFNPRTRMGCDIIAILKSLRQFCFNPRTRMGCDLRKAQALQRYSVSIHAPAWGATPF